MATVEQLSQALKNAHAAGDTAAAQKLAQALQAQGSFQAPVATPELGLVDTFTGGVSRGLGRLGSTFTDVIPAMAASVVGADEYAQEQFAEAEEKQALSQRLNPTQFESFKEVEGIGDFTRFAAETIGEQFGNLGLTVGTALTGGALAPVVGAAKATGQLAGAAFGSYALNAPEVFENVYRETGETAPGTALLFGAAAASLDSILPLALSRSISGPLKAGIATKLLEKSGMSRGVLRSGTAGLFSGLGLEGITEGAQEGISIAAERFIDDNPDVFGSKEFDRIMEASVRGAVAGGGFGTVGGSIEGAREGSQRSQRLQDLTEARELRDEITKKAKEDAAFASDLQDTQAQDPQGDLFGAPVASTILPTEETEVSIANFTNPQIKQEAQRRARENKSKVSVEEKKLKAERAEANKLIKDQKAADKKLAAAQTDMFTAEGAPTPAVEKKYQAAVKAQEKVDTQRRKQLLDAEQLELNLIPSTPSTTVSEEAVAEGQGDIFGGIPGGEITRGPTVGKDLNKFINRQGLPANATNKKIFGGRDLAIPEQRQEVIDGLNEALETRNYNSENIEKIVGVIERLGGTPAQTTTVVASEDVTANDRLAAETLLNEEVDSTVAPVVNPKSTLGKDLLGRLAVQPKTKPKKTIDSTDPVPEVMTKTDKGLAALDAKETASPSEIDVSKAFADSGLRGDAPKKKGRKTKLTKEQRYEQIKTGFQKQETLDADAADLEDAANDMGLANKPTYKGKALNREQRRIAGRGNFKQLLNKLISSQAAEIQRVLRKIRSQSLTTKLVVGNTPEGTSGYYDVDTNTIVLNPQEGTFSGLTEETFLHEASHAALAQALNDPNLQITKDFFKFYSDIKNQMGDAYGGQDLQEFAAELVSNPEFQALLKATKAPNAPANKNLWTNIMEAIARFFGFRPQQSAYTKGLDFIDKILDVSQGVEPTLSGRLFLSTPSEAMGAMSDALTKTPKFIGKKANDVADAISNLVGQEGGGTIASNALRVFRIQDFIRMTENKYPDLAAKLKNLREALLKREGEKEKNLKRSTDKYRKNERIQKKYPQATKRMGVMADIAHRNQFDLTGKVDPEFDINVMVKDADGKDIFSSLSAQKAEYNKLQTEFNSLPAEVQGMYTEMRQDFKDTYIEFREYIKKLAPNSAQKRITDMFARTQPAIGYFPAVRFGDYWLRYTNASGRDVTTAFESERQRKRFIDGNNIENAEVFNKVEDAQYKADTFPEGTFVREVMNVVPTENQNDVYGILLDVMPSNSFDQRLRRYTGKEGASTDLVKVHGDTYLKVLRKINTMKYMPDIQNAINSITSTKSTGFPAAIRDEIQRRGNTGFMQSPSYPKGTSFFATGAYSLFLLGNASAALINTSSVLLLTYPRLVARYGFAQANRVLLSAMKETLPSFRPKDQRAENGLIEYKWQADPKYKTLYDGLMEKAQLEHTLARELLDGTKKDTADFDSRSAKLMNMLSMPFSGAEKYSRATTAIATYNLAKANGKSDSAAVDEAVNEVIDVHTSGLAAEGPGLMQHPLGRIALTFKTFIWNSASVIGYGIYQATFNSDKATRLQAQKQVALIYTMSAAMGGINGLPFFGAAATFANIMEALSSVFDDEEDEPFNFKEFVRSSTNDLVYKGPLNYLTNLEISNRVGLANGLVFREDPYSIERNGYLATAAAQATGPVGSYLLNAGRAFEYLGEGDYRRFSEALSPSALRNIIKATRYMDEGARTRSGEELDTDINAYSLLMQAFGFGPADISNMYENRSLALNFQTKVRNRRKALLKAHYMGIENDDFELQEEALTRLLQLNDLFPGILKKNTLTASYKSHQSYAQDLLLGLKFDAALQDTVTDKFLSDFVA